MENKLAKNSIRIFDNIEIKDTDAHQPDPFMWIDAFDKSKVVFGIENGLNQNVSVQPIGRAGGAEGNLGSATTVNANSDGIVALDLNSYWAPYISVKITAAVAPTSGKIIVYGIWKD